MSEASTFEWIVMSEDAPEEGRVPRYLMVATEGGYAAPKVSADPFYGVINGLTKDGKSFPNGGLLGAKDKMEEDIKAAITSTP
jgi:thiamine pyridinylase